MQHYEDKSLRETGFYSRTLTAAERNYNTTELERLAIVFAVLLLRPCLCGTRFEIRTYHDLLRCILHQDTPSGRLARWKFRLQEFYFEVIYRPVINYIAPDGLSRLNTDGHDDTDIDDKIPILALTKVDTKTIETFNKEVPASQQASPYLYLKQDDDTISRERFLREKARDAYCQNYASFITKVDSNITYDTEGYLVRIAHLDGALQKIVPTNLRKRVLHLAHYPRLQGHPARPECSTRYDENSTGVLWPTTCSIPCAISSTTQKPVALLRNLKSTSVSSRLTSHSNS